MSSKYEILVGNEVRSRDVTVSGIDTFKARVFSEAGLDTDHWHTSRSLREDEVTAIDTWVTKDKRGHRISYSTWRMKTDADVTAFMLRWS